MKTTLRTELPLLLIVAAMFLAAALSWSSAPDVIAVHWNLAGEVDGWGGKVSGLLGLPLIALGTYLLTLLLPRLDPGRANYAAFPGAYTVIRLAVLGVMAAVYAAVHLQMRGHAPHIDTLMPLLIGALFIVLGGVLGKIRPNWFVGIRTPWTLSSKASWTRTHRFGGWLFLGSGIAVLAAAPLGARVVLAVMISGIVVTTLGSLAYSYWVWKKDPEKIPPAGTLPADDNGEPQR